MNLIVCILHGPVLSVHVQHGTDIGMSECDALPAGGGIMAPPGAPDWNGLDAILPALNAAAV